MKNNLLAFILLVIPFGLYAETAVTKPDGDGTAENPYKIENLENLRWLSENEDDWDKHFAQTANIDATETDIWNDGKGFSPIGNISEKFTGSYNGNYYRMESLYINRTDENDIALFGYTDGATIEKLQLDNVNIKGNSHIGGVVGYSENSTISQVAMTGYLKGNRNVGGICGNNDNSTIQEAFSNAIIIADVDNNGGIVSYNDGGTIENSYSLSVIHAVDGSSSGGIVGTTYDGEVANCYFAGTFKGSSDKKGGIVGGTIEPDITYGNFWDIDVSDVTRNM